MGNNAQEFSQEISKAKKLIGTIQSTHNGVARNEDILRNIGYSEYS